MTDKYPRVYAMLKWHGHSPVTALQVIVEAKRGNTYALDWIRVLRGWRKRR